MAGERESYNNNILTTSEILSVDNNHISSLNELLTEGISEDNTSMALNNSKDIDSENEYLKVDKSRRNRILAMDSDSEEELVTSSLLGDFSLSATVAQEEKDFISSQNEIVTEDNERNESKDIEFGSENSRRGKFRRKHIIMDSDSEEELVSSLLVDDFLTTTIGEQQKHNKITNSESEDDNSIVSSNKDVKTSSSQKKQHRPLVESDSDEVTTHNKSFADEAETINKEATIYTTNYKGELIAENPKTKKSIWTDLCDSESSDEEVNQGLEKPNENDQVFHEIIEPIPYKKKERSKGQETVKKMTGKEAAELRKEIQSESQRMVREMDVSLPYHRPKQFTLKEFLSRRPKLSTSLAGVGKMAPSVAMKMSREQLKDVLKKLEKRKVEVQEFYKSESEPEDNNDDENDADYVPPDNENTISSHVEDAFVSTKDTVTVQDSEINVQEIIGDNIEPVASKNVELNDEGNESIANNVMDEKESSDKLEQPEVIIENESSENLKYQYSMDYEFNLDDMEENSQNILQSIETLNQTEKPKETIETENIDRNLLPEETSNKIDDSNNPKELIENPLDPANRFDYTELDREIENFGNNRDVNEVEKPKFSKMELIREINFQPRLSGDPNHVIDLDRCITRPQQVTKLMERFLQHNTKHHHHKNRVKVNIVSVESGEIHKETLAMNVDDEDPTEKEEKPGAKLSKLRCDLRDQIKKQKSEIWQKKTKLDDTEGEEKDPYEGEKSDCGGDDDILDDDDEEEMSESSEEEENEEELPEEKNSVFFDNEAQESDREVEDEENDVQNKRENEEEIDENEDEDSKSSNTEEKIVDVSVNKTLKRIVKGFTEDSDDEDDTFNSQKTVSNVITKLNESITEETTQDDDCIPPYQVHNIKTPIKQIPLTAKPDYDFLTPISYITGLQNLNSASKPKSSVTKSPFQMPNVPSPLKDSNWQSNLQKKLFSDSEISSSQAEAIAEMCSNKFSDSQESTDDKSRDYRTLNLSPDSPKDLPCTALPNTQDLLKICSGDFPGSTESQIPTTLPPTSQDLLDICSGDFTAASEDWPENSVVTHAFNPAEEVKNLGVEEDMIISQLLDEEEMATFKRKFDSPLMSGTQRRIVEEFEERTAGGGVLDSDDEDDGLGVKKRKNQTKLTFSDDDSSDDDENQEEEIDLQDDIEEDDEDVPADNIGYDSEENEVEYVDDEDQHQELPKQLKAADFFENEAELSESEWGSADEDEKDLDTLEFEQGDTEKFDEKQMRTDLERIHMRRMLDDDTREVKLLQELLLEDGELHGSGRERQFKWKNLDSMGNDNEDRKEDEDNENYLDEDESEEQWRRKRFEREMFLKEKQLKSQAIVADDDDGGDIVEGSQFLKIGHKVLGKSQSNSQSSVSVEKAIITPASQDIKCTFSFMNKRGSFLSRNDQVLQRLAEYNKQTTSIALGTATAKNSRNFLFQTVSVEKTSSEIEMKKRKTTDDTPRAIKKLRLSDNLSPAVKKKPERPGAKAKLFGN